MAPTFCVSETAGISVADLERLQSGVQPPQPLVEQAVEQHDGGLELVGEDPHPAPRPEASGVAS